jgi:formylglycine-generating enzyme required for sulfatase activity
MHCNEYSNKIPHMNSLKPKWPMNTLNLLIPGIRPFVLLLPMLVSFVASSLAQEVSIPDPALNTAIREALGKPAGPLTQQDMLSLTNLGAVFRNITNVQGLEAAQNLVSLDLQDNRITSVDVLTNLTRLVFLDVSENRFPQLTLPAGMTNLTALRAEFGGLTNVALPAGLTKLTSLRLGFNQLSDLTLPADMTNLSLLSVVQNQLTNLTLPPNLNHLTQLELARNNLTNLILPAGLTSLAVLNLTDNQLTHLTLPPDLQQLVGLFVGGNSLATFVLSEPLATTGMASVVDSFRNQSVAVFTYPLVAQLVQPLALIGSFKFGIIGPPGVYSVLGSANLETWSTVGFASNPLGSVLFHDVTTNVLPQKYYRVLRQVPPANMVFIPPNTFTMGTPTNEVNRQADEGPQTTVTLSRGFWIGKYEVTQREYLAVTGSNPSQFPGDLNRPVETVSWLDATNYCALLTQQELAAGRIPWGSRYRLPTEAEWECAARAGTSTRFSYGDDVNFSSLANHAWYWFNSGFGTHPVGQKLPNPWGLYDMEGNVLEWTLDWYGPYPGGSVTDPEGPASNVQGVKVIRGGAWDAGEADCRSGRRLTKGVHPFITDFILGFRVVLVTEKQ